MTAWVLGAYDEPSVLVTQCSNVDEARRIAASDCDVAAALLGDDSPSTLRELEEWLATAEVAMEYGRVHVAQPGGDYTWYWRGWTTEGRERAHGETTAVRFMAPDHEGPVG